MNLRSDCSRRFAGIRCCSSGLLDPFVAMVVAATALPSTMGYEWTEFTLQQILASKDLLTKLAFPLGVVQIGLIVFIGLAAKNAILIVEFAKQLEDTGKPRYEATVEAVACACGQF